MSYDSRIPAAADYLQCLGRAFYNYTYLEWIVVWTLVKLSQSGFGAVPVGKPAASLAKALEGAIQNSSPPLPDALRRSLLSFAKEFRAAIKKRNKLLHAHPFTASDGSQQLGGGGHTWPMEEVDRVAQFFEATALSGNGIFHGPLSKARP